MQVDKPRPASLAVAASPTSGLEARPSSEVAASPAVGPEGPEGPGSIKDGPAAASLASPRLAKGDYVVILAGGGRHAEGPLSVGKYGIVVADDKSPDTPFMVRQMSA